MDDAAISLQRRTIVYSGHVQGVGFRASTQQRSKGFDVRGYVRNLDDGCVELVVEGTVDEIDRFLAAVANDLSPFIRDTQVRTSPATGEFKTFAIRV